MTRGDLDSGREDHALGALLGLAVGDALGTTLEFSSRDSRPLQTEMRGGGPFQLKAGQWTDDTSMALALAESLAANSDFDPLDLMTRFVSWYETGAYSCTGTCFDIGVTTRQAIHRFKATGNPFAGSENPRSAGNGSIMRLAPVALNSLGERAEAARIARDQSRTTHAAAQCVEACDFLVQILLDAIDGAGKAALEARSWSGDEAIVRIASGAWRSKSR